MGVIIMGGDYRGRKLQTDTRARVIRPTSGKVREALFSSLGERVPESRFVDLYAGSGAVGLEALSRGAAEVHLVESHPQSLALLRSNIQTVTGSPGRHGLHLNRSDVAAFCQAQAKAGSAFDILFADPPFDKDRDFEALPALLRPLLNPEGMAVIQYPIRNPPAWLDHAGKLRAYGESGLAFFVAEELPDGAGTIF